MTLTHQLRELAAPLRRYAYSLTGHMADADDLLQSTLERLLSKPVPAGIELQAWAFRVCRNLWIDEYRSRQVREKAANDPALQATAHDGTEHVENQITLAKVHQAMATLKDEQRELIGLVAVEGKSYKEVAAALGIPIGTVMSRLARARAILTDKLSSRSQTQAQSQNPNLGAQ